MNKRRFEVEAIYGANSNVLNEDVTESTEKLENYEVKRQFDIILEIIKVHTELSVGE